MENVPVDLEEFFSTYPEVAQSLVQILLQICKQQSVKICGRNLEFTRTPNKPLARDGVLFITQRRQATSDIRENPKVRKPKLFIQND